MQYGISRHDIAEIWAQVAAIRFNNGESGERVLQARRNAETALAAIEVTSPQKPAAYYQGDRSDRYRKFIVV